MTLFLDDSDFKLYVGDVRDVMRELPDESVDCVVTSPPYWGLRDYGGEEKQIGLERTPQEYVATMVLLFSEIRRVLASHGTVWLNLGDSYVGGGRGGKDGDQLGANSLAQAHHDAGVRWGPPTGSVPGLKHKDLVGIPWRVAFALQDDGWWLRSDNIWSKPNPMPESVTDRTTKSHEYMFMLTKTATPHFWTNAMTKRSVAIRPKPDIWWFPPLGVYGVPSSDLMLVERQRAHFISLGWSKRNVWQGHDYFYDQEPTREQYAEASEERYKYSFGGAKNEAMAETEFGRTKMIGKRELPVVEQPTLGDLPPEAPRGPDGRRNTHVEKGDNSIQPRDGERWAHTGRNMRTVWEIPVTPYRDAHFATFPEKLVAPCVLMGCPERVCRTCGKPSVRLFETVTDDDALKGTGWDSTYVKPEGDDHGRSVSEMYRDSLTKRRVFLGWSDCGHDDWRAGIVLDPFMGSGTTAKVARDHGRHALGIELNEGYAQLCADRTRQLSLMGGS